MESSTDRPTPELGPRSITLDQYMSFTPEKLELISGFLIDGPESHDERRDLLQLLLTNEGLEAAVRLAPEHLWREALRLVYGRA